MLITGGAGFLGSNFIRQVLGERPEERVVNLDRLVYPPARATIQDLDRLPGHKFVYGDIRDRDLVASLVRDTAVVVNFAAESHVDRSITDPRPFTDTNMGGTTTLLEAAAAAGVGRFVHISTDEVYGPILDGAAMEDCPLHPSSPYAAAKAGADLMVGAFAVTYGYQAIIARPCNNMGPFQFPEKVIPRFVTRALNGKSVPLYGDGRHVRDWMFVDDTCAAIDLLVRGGSPGEVYNISAGDHLSNEQLVHSILRNLGADPSLIQYVADRPGHDVRYATDSSKLRALGWEPETNLEEALTTTVTWYEQHRDWWEPFLELLN